MYAWFSCTQGAFFLLRLVCIAAMERKCVIAEHSGTCSTVPKGPVFRSCCPSAHHWTCALQFEQCSIQLRSSGQKLCFVAWMQAVLRLRTFELQRKAFSAIINRRPVSVLPHLVLPLRCSIPCNVSYIFDILLHLSLLSCCFQWHITYFTVL